MDTHYIHGTVSIEVKTGKHYDTLDVKTATGEYIFFCEDTDQLKELLVKALASIPEEDPVMTALADIQDGADKFIEGLTEKQRLAKLMADGEAGLKAIL